MGLELLRVPFPAHQISTLPKGGVKLSYVGHAALTDRLLDADPNWTWEPLALDDRGLPALDGFGGMWIRLTVCGVTRLGYGHAGTKEGGDAIKEVIGDALRNAAMRFGAALDLWHKGELHKDEPERAEPPKQVGEPGAITGVKAAAMAASGGVAAVEDAPRVIDLAEKIKKTIGVNGATKTAKFIDQEELDDTQLIFLSTLLPSNINNALKKAQAAMREEAKETT
jgi:hypothetical protein